MVGSTYIKGMNRRKATQKKLRMDRKAGKEIKELIMKKTVDYHYCHYYDL